MTERPLAGTVADSAHLEPALAESGGELWIALRVRPGAKRSVIQGMIGDRLKVAVAAPPVDGKANKALLSFLAKVFGVAKRDVRLVAGTSSRDKRVAVAVAADAGRRALRLALPPTP